MNNFRCVLVMTNKDRLKSKIEKYLKKLKKEGYLALDEIYDYILDLNNEEVDVTVDILISSLQNKDVDIRMWAARCLGIFMKKAQKAIPSLILMLDDPYDSVRLNAVKSLGSIRIPDKEVLKALELAIKEQSDIVKTEALKSLTELRRREALKW